jgi:hypothetical protein
VEGRAASDRFWSNFYDTCFFGAFEISSSLSEITSESDLVVRGTIPDLSVIHREGFFSVEHVTLQVSEVLKGTGQADPGDILEIRVRGGYGVDDLRAMIPAHDHLWFLEDSEDFPGSYYSTDYEQVSVLRGIDGVVQVIMPNAIANAFSRDQYPIPLDGTSFEELLQRVRDLVTSEGSTRTSLSMARTMAC